MNAWRDAALGVGENLSTIGPDHYYDFDVVTWTSWAISQVRGLNAEIAASRAERDRLKAANAEMLEALKSIIEWWEDDRDFPAAGAKVDPAEACQWYKRRLMMIANAARAVIAKAEGL